MMTELNDNALAETSAASAASELTKVQTDIAWLEHKRNLLIPYLRLVPGKARSFIVSQIEGLDVQIAALYAVLSCVNHPSNKYYVNKTPVK